MRKRKTEKFVSVLDKPEYKDALLRAARDLRDAMAAIRNGVDMKTLFPFASER